MPSIDFEGGEISPQLLAEKEVIEKQLSEVFGQPVTLNSIEIKPKVVENG